MDVDAMISSGTRDSGAQPSAAPDPWTTYTRHATGSGWASPLGRDQVRAALLDVGGAVDRLVIGWRRTPREDDLPGFRILSLRHSSDARSGYITARDTFLPSVTMTVYAVPSDRRRGVQEELLRSRLAEACAWLLSSRGRGNAWSASSHEWVLWLRGEDLVVTES